MATLRPDPARRPSSDDDDQASSRGVADEFPATIEEVLVETAEALHQADGLRRGEDLARSIGERDALDPFRPDDAPTRDDLYAPQAGDRPVWHVRLFGTDEFFRMWLVQVVSALGDWLGFTAIIVLATRIGGAGGAAAVSLVMAARIIPGFFFGPVAGVFVDRLDRKKVMVLCDLGRAAVVFSLPFVDNLAGLVVASLALEVMTLLWAPAKDATVPSLVPQDHLTTANSLSLAAAYGTFPFASLLFALLAGVSAVLVGIPALDALHLDQMSLAFYVDGVTFLVAAWLIHRLVVPPRERRIERADSRRIDLMATVHELKEGWQYIFINHTVRAVNLGLATGLIGGGMLIPLGALFATEVLGAGDAGYGFFMTALGFGVAAGAVGVSVLQRRLPKARTFTTALFLAGVALFAASSSSVLGITLVFVFLMGAFVGPVYVVGFSLLQEEVSDDLRGRVFSSLNTLVRLCVLVSMVAGPLLAAALGSISESLFGGVIEIGPWSIAVPGVRLALWLASLIIVVAALLARHSVKSGQRIDAARDASHPSRGSTAQPSSPERGAVADFLDGAAVTAQQRTGLFVAFEGGEGCGKSTQAALLADRLDAVLTREPGDTAIGARIRELLLDPATVGLDPRAEALLMAADRAQHVREVVRPALESGRAVVTDRYAGSSIAYQGGGRGLDPDEIRGLSAWATGGLWPDLTILLDVPLEVTASRLARELDRFEQEDLGFHERLLASFRSQARADPDGWVVIDGTQSVEAVASLVANAVDERLQRSP